MFDNIDNICTFQHITIIQFITHVFSVQKLINQKLRSIYVYKNVDIIAIRYFCLLK